jgi:hypothetical protein
VADYVKLIDVSANAAGRRLNVAMNRGEGLAVGYLAPVGEGGAAR